MYFFFLSTMYQLVKASGVFREIKYSKIMFSHVSNLTRNTLRVMVSISHLIAFLRSTHMAPDCVLNALFYDE